MRILVEHPSFTPFKSVLAGGTERFVQTAAEALRLRGHEVDVFASADSTLPCIKSEAYSVEWCGKRKTLFKSAQWYFYLFSQTHDAIILNTALSSPVLLGPVYAPNYRRCVYFNHNSTDRFVGGFCGKQMNVVLRYFRSNGGRAHYFSETNRRLLEADWAKPDSRRRAVEGKAAAGLRRIGDTSFLAYDLFDGHFNQAVAPTGFAARPAAGYLISIGRDDTSKRHSKAVKLAKKLGRELFVVTPAEAFTHDMIMAALSEADCLLLPSRDETFSIVCFEAMCYGVPVSMLEIPPALELYPPLAREWGDVGTTTLAERKAAHEYLTQTYTLDAFGQRLEATFPGRGEPSPGPIA